MKKMLLLVGCITLWLAGFAQKNHPIRRLNGTVTFADTLATRIGRIAQRADIPGLCVVILQNKRIAYQQYFGFKNRDQQQRPDGQTVWYAASFTKPVIAYLTLKLVEAKKLDLDRPIHHYLQQPIECYDKFKDLAASPGFYKITPRMLLSHSAGLPILRGFYDPQLTLIADPGTRFYYSNEGMNLLGLALEECLGENLQALAQRYVFEPLKMYHSALVWQPGFEANYAVGHNSMGVVLGAQKRTSVRAAGSLVTTPLDYARFVRCLLRRERLSKALWQEMFSPQILVGSKAGFGPDRDVFNHAHQNIRLAWGLGWGLFESPVGPAFFHSGNLEGWQNYCVGFPRQGTAIILMSNSDNFEPAARQILEEAIGDRYSPLDWLGY